jgi:hypothetical protein
MVVCSDRNLLRKVTCQQGKRVKNAACPFRKNLTHLFQGMQRHAPEEKKMNISSDQQS